MKLNLGCGSDYRQGYINVDRISGVADVIHDLNEFPYPWPDNAADEILICFKNAILGWFFNRHKYIYTTTILAYLFPAYEIRFVMTPLK